MRLSAVSSRAAPFLILFFVGTVCNSMVLSARVASHVSGLIARMRDFRTVLPAASGCMLVAFVVRVTGSVRNRNRSGRAVHKAHP